MPMVTSINDLKHDSCSLESFLSINYFYRTNFFSIDFHFFLFSNHSLITKSLFYLLHRLFLLVAILLQEVVFGQFLQPLALDGLGSECALILSGGSRSSAYDHTVNLLRLNSL